MVVPGPALHDTLDRLARAAGAAIMAVYRDPGFAVQAKVDASPVTEADLAADRIIVDGLTAAFPGVPIVTEERPESHDLGQGRAHFLVDPLDGTKEFVQRRGNFTVNIALIDAGGLPVAGVVLAPAVGRLFRTAAGGGAVEVLGDGRTVPLSVAEADTSALRVVASQSHRDAETDAWIARHAVASVLSTGSSLKFCLLAAGEADVYPRFGRTMEWDTAAADAVLRAAGGRTLRLADGAPLVYGKPDRANPPFLAMGRGVLPPGGPTTPHAR